MSGPQACHEQDEQAPLLVRSQSAITTTSQYAARKSKASRKIVFTFISIVLLISMGDQLLESPQMRIQEAVICYRYYEDVDPSKIKLDRGAIGPGAIGGVDELWCKTGKVQSDLVMLRGWQSFFDGIPSLALAVPFGWAADRFGRKPFLLAGLFAITTRGAWIALVLALWQRLDIRAQWLSTAFASLGGGAATTSSLAFVVLSDLTSAAERGVLFLRIGAFNLLANLVMPPLAAWLMAQYNPWVPYLAGISLNVLSVIAIVFMPETLGFGQPQSSGAAEVTRIPASGCSPDQESLPSNTAFEWFKKARQAASFLSEDWRIPILVLPFILYLLLGDSTQLVIQFMSNRYDITVAKSTLVATIRSGMIVVVLFLLLPQLSSFMVKKMHISPQRKDLNLARMSHIFMSIGWFAFGLAPTLPIAILALVIQSLDQGASYLLRSFLTSLLPQNRIASAFSVITIAETTGAMLGAPLLADLMKTGLEVGGFWFGMPFYFIGVVSGVMALLLFVVGLREGEGDEDGLNNDDT